MAFHLGERLTGVAKTRGASDWGGGQLIGRAIDRLPMYPAE